MGGEKQDRADAPLLVGGLIAGCCALILVVAIAFILMALFGVRIFGIP